MEAKKRILLIDNQKTQYLKIAGLLPEYEIFPGGEYDKFMNWVRIWVTVSYKSKRKNFVIGEIISRIRTWEIDLFIIDFKLAANTGGSTGIYLGQRLLSEFNQVPIIYLSRTPYNSKDLGDERLRVNPEQWVEKGYTGLNILDQPYFDLHVRKKIRQLLSPAGVDLGSYYETLNKLSKTELFGTTLWEYFRVITETKPPGEPEIAVINELDAKSRSDAGNSTLKQILFRYIKTKNQHG